jgi:hypothetical protein
MNSCYASRCGGTPYHGLRVLHKDNPREINHWEIQKDHDEQREQ